MYRTVLALDLSKTSTGFAIAHWDPGISRGTVARFGTIRPPAAAKGTRWFYPVIETLLAQLEREIADEQWFVERTFSMVIEASVYGKSFSEFQFYLTQDALRWASRLGVDVCTFAPSTLKAWIRRWSTQTLSKNLDKTEIESVWRTELRPLCPAAFPNSNTVTDDAVDAGWLSVLALYAQAHILPVGRFQLGKEVPALWKGSDPLRKAFMSAKLNKLGNVANPDLSESYANLRSNKHLSLLGKGFYPFRQLDGLAQHIRREAVTDFAATLATIQERSPPRISSKSLRTSLEDGRFSCALDQMGRLLLVPEVGHFPLERAARPPASGQLAA